MSGSLKGKAALVTGSVQGIGLAIAKSLAGEGARIALHGLADEALKAAARAEIEAAGGQSEFFAGDLRDPAAIAAMMAAVDEWGPVDILVNNAGVQRTVPLAEATRELWDAMLAINLSAAFDTMRLALPGMAARGYGRVVNIASVQGLIGSVEKAPYVASKHGLIGLSKVAALEYAAKGDRAKGGVTVNCICPGFTETAILGPQIEDRAALHGGDRDAGIASLLSEKQPSRRLSAPSEIGELAAFLCRPSMHNLTGAAMPVDGGWTTQ